jgi:hypothetical protein
MLRHMSIAASASVHSGVDETGSASGGSMRRATMIGAMLIPVLFVAAVALPLATYTTALALFGLAHVVSELRYVDLRFGARLRGGLAPGLGLLLLGAAGLRFAGGQGWIAAEQAYALELALVAMMAAAIVPRLKRRRLAAVATTAVIGGGAVLAPLETMAVLAILHNLTPLGFVAEALHGAQRRRALVALAVPFVLLPALIATGWPLQILAENGLYVLDASLFAAGPLDLNLGAYVPPALHDSAWALHLFSAAVFAQCMHYAVVIGVLPRLVAGRYDRQAFVPWPRPRRFVAAVIAGAAGLAIGFALDYAAARQLYALVALVHAWIEIPVLLIALAGGVTRR